MVIFYFFLNFNSQSFIAVFKWRGCIMMGCETPLQILIVLPSLCFCGNSLLPSGGPSSPGSSNGFLHCPTDLILSPLFFFSSSQRSFFTLSTYLITILFHLLSIILFLSSCVSFSFYSPPAFALSFFFFSCLI